MTRSLSRRGVLASAAAVGAGYPFTDAPGRAQAATGAAEFRQASALDVRQAVASLRSRWYGVLTRAMRLDLATFRLIQGGMVLHSPDSSQLFLISDSVPPPGSDGYVGLSGLSKRSSAYQLLLEALLIENGTGLRQVLGPMYVQWVRYRNRWWREHPDSHLTQVALFRQWANSYLDPEKAAAAIDTYRKAASAPLNKARDALHAPGAQQEFAASDGSHYKLYRYSATIDAATRALAEAPGIVVDFASDAASTGLRRGTVPNGDPAELRFFDGPDAGFADLDRKAARAVWSVKGYVNAYATLTTDPLVWFNSGELARAYHGKGDDTIWDPLATAGTWDSFFARPNGSLARRISQLLLVSDYRITVRSHAAYSSSEYQRIATGSTYGAWPMLSRPAPTARHTVHRHHDDGSVEITFTLAPGLMEIWGVSVENAPR